MSRITKPFQLNVSEDDRNPFNVEVQSSVASNYLEDGTPVNIKKWIDLNISGKHCVFHTPGLEPWSIARMTVDEAQLLIKGLKGAIRNAKKSKPYVIRTSSVQAKKG